MANGGPAAAEEIAGPRLPPGFFGVFPWNAVTYWFFRYLEKERGYSSSAILVTMVTVVVVLAAGYPLAGMLGDRLFRRTARGRLLVSIVGVAVGTVLFFITMHVPVTVRTAFLVMLLPQPSSSPSRGPTSSRPSAT